MNADALLASPKRDLPRTAEAALRRSIPIFNAHTAALQSELETVQYFLRIPQRKPWASMATSAATAGELAADADAWYVLLRTGSVAATRSPHPVVHPTRLTPARSCASNHLSIELFLLLTLARVISSDSLRGVLPSDLGTAHELLDGVQSDLARLQRAIDVKDPERTSIRVANALERLGQIELLQSPGLKYQLPARYAGLPRLTGRAVLEMTVTPRAGGNKQVVELTLDGFSAPLTSGRMLQNVLRKKYDGTTVRADDTSIYVDTSSRDARATKVDTDGDLPLEIFVRGDFEPTYRSELNVNDFDEIPLIPLSVDGALAATRAGDGLSSPTEFFVYKYNRSQSGLAGLSFDEGSFAVFGYVTSDRDSIRLLNDGDRIDRIRVVSGADKLVNGGSGKSSDDESGDQTADTPSAAPPNE